MCAASGGSCRGLKAQGRQAHIKTTSPQRS
nr:MAG TPA: hypothetical protein [Caudoviricetes sp.]